MEWDRVEAFRSVATPSRMGNNLDGLEMGVTVFTMTFTSPLPLKTSNVDFCCNLYHCFFFFLQMVRNFRKPLIVVGPKLLLRLPVSES